MLEVRYTLTPARPTETPVGSIGTAVAAERLRGLMEAATGEPWTVVALFPAPSPTA